MASLQAMWVLRGDPQYGGSMDVLSSTVGVVARNAYCYGPDGELYFLAADGLYVLPPGANGFPKPLSKDRLPRELSALETQQYDVCMVYDRGERGIHIILNEITAFTERLDWWFDVRNGGFWPTKILGQSQPAVCLDYASASNAESGPIFGSSDGWIRRFHRTQPSDRHGDTTSTYSYVLIGPIAMGPDGGRGTLQELVTTLASTGDGALIQIFAGESAEEAVRAGTATGSTWDATGTPVWYGTASAGINYAEHFRVGANWITIRLSRANYSKVRWAIESLRVQVQTGGAGRRL